MCSRLAAILLGLAVVLLGAMPEGMAQNDSGSVYIQRPPPGGRNPFEWLFGGRRQSGVAVTNRTDPGARSYKARRKSTPTTVRPAAPSLAPSADPSNPTGDPSAPQVADAPPSPPPMTPVNIAVIGDSLSIFLAQGLQEIYADRPAVTFTRRNRESSGLVRDDYHDWPKALRELLAAGQTFDAVVIMIGSNDRQQLRDENGVHEPRSERWNELYAKRVEAIIAIARERKVPLIWIGMPTMRADRFRADMLAFNDIYRREAKTAGIAYVDVWEAFAAEDGDYVINGPDVGGEIVRLRTADGVHFTKAGARKLAFFADKEIQKVVALRQERNPPPVIASAPDPGQLPDGVRSSPQINITPALPEPKALTVDLLPPPPAPRPLQGPVIVLTAPPTTPGGQLLAPRSPAQSRDASNVFVGGQPTSAKSGRADDFTLPRE